MQKEKTVQKELLLSKMQSHIPTYFEMSTDTTKHISALKNWVQRVAHDEENVLKSKKLRILSIKTYLQISVQITSASTPVSLLCWCHSKDADEVTLRTSHQTLYQLPAICGLRIHVCLPGFFLYIWPLQHLMTSTLMLCKMWILRNSKYFMIHLLHAAPQCTILLSSCIQAEKS